MSPFWRRRKAASVGIDVVRQAGEVRSLGETAQARVDAVRALVAAGEVPAAEQVQGARDLMVLLRQQLGELFEALPPGRPEAAAIFDVMADADAAVTWLDTL